MSLCIGVPCQEGMLVASDRAVTSDAGGVPLPSRDTLKKLWIAGDVLFTVLGTQRLRRGALDWSLVDAIIRNAPTRLEVSDLEGLAAVVAKEATAVRFPAESALLFFFPQWTVASFAFPPASGTVKSTPVSVAAADPRAPASLILHAFSADVQSKVIQAERLTNRSKAFANARRAVFDVALADAMHFAIDVQMQSARIFPVVGGGVDVALVRFGGGIETIGHIPATPRPCPCKSGKAFEACHGDPS